MLLLIIDAHIAGFLLFESGLFFGYLICFAICHLQTLSQPLRIQARQFKSRKTIKEIIIRSLLEKFHEMYVFYLKKFISIDKNVVQWAYTVLFSAASGFNVIAITGLIQDRYEAFAKFQVLAILSAMFLIGILSSQVIIYVSKSLKCSSKYCVKFMASNCANFKVVGVVKLFKFSSLIEIVHHKDRFWFHFGELGQIHNRSIFGFIFWYITFILFVYLHIRI